MRVLRLAILTLALSFSVIGAAWANGDLTDGTPVPEPGSLVLLLTGIGAGAAVFFRRRK
jgi:PEP-CTERM motif